METEKKTPLTVYVLLHLLLMFYSLGGICSKTAAGYEFLSWGFIVFYGLLLLDMAVYAVLWQQILKRMPLTKAFSAKAVTVIWGMLWGVLFFHETLTVTNIIGGVLVLAGVYLAVSSDE
ncbi:MAG: EamA family transporter [Huintestinicola sp.]